MLDNARQVKELLVHSVRNFIPYDKYTDRTMPK